MNKTIVITSIFEPSEAVIKFSQKSDFDLIVVGDKKTPSNWKCGEVPMFSFEQQKASGYRLKKNLPCDHYARKMFGYLWAIQNGADIIVDADDDNIPNEDYGFPLFEDEYNYINDNLGFVNIYELYTNQKIWPRGLPLTHSNKKTIKGSDISKKKTRIGVWQGLVDGTPDTDAIFRLTINEPCLFEKSGQYVVGKNTIAPFNSQNTGFRKELFALLYLPAFVTFRFTDILRGLIAQPIMWLYGYHLGFTNANVVQKRNIHDHMSDFESEIPVYLYCDRIVEIVSSSLSTAMSIKDNLYNAYYALHKQHIVSAQELKTLEYWIYDYTNCTAP